MSNKFKILYCTGSISVKGGTERVLANKSKIFAEELGIEVHISTLTDNSIKAYDFSNKIKFHHVRIIDSTKKFLPALISNQIYKKKLYQRYASLIEEIKPNVVIVLERGTDDFYLPQICKRLNIPIVREFHFAKNAVKEKVKIIESIKERFVYKFAYYRIFKAFNNYDYLVLLTKRDQKEGKYKTKTVVIPNIVSPFTLKANTIKSKSVISVGSINDKRKGFEDIIIAWKEVTKHFPDWTLNIYGDGKNRTKLINLVKALNIENSVNICGSSSTIEKNYSDSSFFVSASVAEGLPMVLIEAMNCGLPCIAYDCPTGPSDIIESNKNGLLIKFKDRIELTNAILQMIRNVDSRSNMSINAINTSKRFTKEKIIPLWINLFEKFGYLNEAHTYNK